MTRINQAPETIWTIEGMPHDIWAPLCPMCQVLKAVHPPFSENASVWGAITKLLLMSPFSYQLRNTVGCVEKPIPLIVIEWDELRDYNSTNYLSVQSDSKQPIKLLDPQHIDLDTINGWLSTCLDSHTHLCGLELYPEIRGLRVIDVHTKTLKLAERDTRYVALSYVWGQPKQNPPAPEPPAEMGTANPPQEQENLSLLPNDLPCTILDAMTVTASLGFQYLWIDRYCVPQGESDSEDRDDQIRQMDKVYRNAEVTIIAAAGEGPEHGLPGVGSTARVPQAHARIGNHTLISTIIWPDIAVSRSKWSSRGWTYQEAICSRRRLVFTDQQVFFECQQMSCRENVDHMWPLTEYSIFNEKNKVGMEAKWHHIENYTRRQLTYDSDALNASLGIIRLQSEPGHPVVHFWGIPMTLHTEDADDDDSSTSDSRNLQESFLQSLLWSPWLSLTSARRRQDFPTWSWTAWAREIKFDPSIARPGFKQLGITASIGYKDGSFRDLEYAYHHNLKPGYLQNLSNTLRLRGKMLKLMTKVLEGRTSRVRGHELFAWPMNQHEQYGDVQVVAPASFLPQVDEAKMALWQKEPLQLFGFLGGWISPNYDPEIFVILLSKVGTNTYERVGHVQLQEGSCANMYRLNGVTGKGENIKSEECNLRTEKWLTDSILCDIDLV